MRESRLCPECNTTLKFKRIVVHFERGDFAADVHDVPAYVCPQCGTEIIPGAVAEQIGQIVEHLFRAAQSSPEHRLPFTSLSLHAAAT